MKKLTSGLLTTILIATTWLAGCHQTNNNAHEIKVGTIAGPETELMETAATVAAKQGLTVDVVQFNDYTMPNEALADGSIDANMFQHQPYLDAAIKAKEYPLVAVGKTFIYPVGIYSQKIKKLSELNTGATVAVPNDPSNEARALLLLQTAGLTTLKPNADITATIEDIADNPKQLVFKEIDAAQLPRVLPDVDLAVINTNYAMLADLLPSRDALFVEQPNSPYANILVVRQSQANDPRFKILLNALHSPEVLQEADVLFKGQAVPAWQSEK